MSSEITRNFPITYMGYDEVVDLLHAEQRLAQGMERKLLTMQPGSDEGRQLYERLQRQEERVRDVAKMVREHPDRHPEGMSKAEYARLFQGGADRGR